MASDHLSAPDGHSPHSPHSPDSPKELSVVDLEQRLLDQTNHVEPGLTVFGFGSSTAWLGHECERPENAILGLTLPREFAAVGVIASSVVAYPPDRAHRDASLALGVSRSGKTVSFVATPETTMRTNDPQGWLIDACLRAVDQPTPPCPVPPLEFPIALWLDRLMVALLHDDAPLLWRDAVELCPAPDRWRSTDPIDLGTTLGSTAPSWRTLRLSASRGAKLSVNLDPGHAAWMDDPMFARWCMGSFPEVSNLRSDVEFLASPIVAERIELTLRAAWSAAAR